MLFHVFLSFHHKRLNRIKSVKNNKKSHKKGSTEDYVLLFIRGLRSRMPFPGNRIFSKKIREIPGPEHSGTSSSRSRLSPENETGIPEFEISGKIRENSRNSVLDGKFPVGYWNMLFGFQFISIPFKTFPEWYRVVPSRPEFFPNFSQIFPKFFPNFSRIFPEFSRATGP